MCPRPRSLPAPVPPLGPGTPRPTLPARSGPAVTPPRTSMAPAPSRHRPPHTSARRLAPTSASTSTRDRKRAAHVTHDRRATFPLPPGHGGPWRMGGGGGDTTRGPQGVNGGGGATPRGGSWRLGGGNTTSGTPTWGAEAALQRWGLGGMRTRWRGGVGVGCPLPPPGPPAQGGRQAAWLLTRFILK